METTVFCSQCGTKLNQNAKFCHACGAKINSTETDTTRYEDGKENVSHKLYEQYKNIISGKVIDAYCDNVSIAKNILYQNGINYGFTNDMVDAAINEEKDKIDTFENHLKNFYASDIMPIPDCTPNKAFECVSFGENIGFDEEYAHDIYNTFIQRNQLSDKFSVIMSELKNYESKGITSDFDSIPESKNLDNNRFYLHFEKAVSELRKFQQSLHDKNNSDVLTENDLKNIRTKATELGFYDIFTDDDFEDTDDDSEDIYVIDMLITGNEIKLGYTAKANENMFSKIIPFRTVQILGEELCFESSYFLYEYIQNNYQTDFTHKAKQLAEVLQKVSKHISHPDVIDVIENCGKIIESIWEKSFLTLQNSLPLNSEDKNALYQSVKEKIAEEHFGVVDWELKMCAAIFEEIDENVNDAALEGKIKQLTRNRWSGGGFGVAGAVKGAVTATVLDAGTGLLYGVANNISLSNTKNKAEKKKIEAFRSTLSFLDMALKAIPEWTERYAYWFLKNRYVFNSSCDDEDLEKIYDGYLKEKSEKSKNEMALRLIKLAPQNEKYYVPLMEQIFNEDSDKAKNDVAALCKISEWFKVDLAKEKQSFENDKKNEILQKYSKDDITRCELIFRLESILGYQTDAHNTILREYLTNNSELQFKKYTFDELYAIAGELKTFGERFSYPADSLVFSKLKIFAEYHMKNNLSMTPNDLKKWLSGIDLFCKKCPEVQQQAKDLHTDILDTYLMCSSTLNIEQYTVDELSAVADAVSVFSKTFPYSETDLLCDRIKQYTDYHIKHDLKSYTPKNINECCKNIDLLYDKFPAAHEILDAAKQQLMQTVFKHYNIKLCSNDKQQTEYNVEKLTYLAKTDSLDFSSHVKKETERLQKINKDEDVTGRTVYGVLYDTLEEANMVRNEMDILEKMTKEAADLSMSQRLFKIMQHNFKTKQAQSEIEKRGNQLIEHIESLRNSSHHKSSALRFCLSLLATPIIACIGIAFSLPGIIIALIVILAVWSAYNETRKENKAYNTEASKKKTEIKEFDSLFSVKNNKLIMKK